MIDAYTLETLKDGSFGILHEPNGSTDGNYSHLLTDADLTEKDRSLFQSLFVALNVDYNAHKHNLGLVKISDYSPKWYAGPIIYKADGELVLALGAENKNEGLEPLVLPVQIGSTGVKINGKNFLLDRIEREYLEGNTKVKVTIPVACFLSGDDMQSITIKADKDAFSWGKFSLYVSNDDQESIMGMLGTLTSGNYCNVGKLFAPHFAAKVFPPKGYVIPVINVEFKESQYGYQAWIKVDCSAIPGSSINFGGDVVPTSSVVCLTLGENHNGYKNLMSLNQTKSVPTSSKPFYLWVQGQGRSTDTVPRHIIVDQMLVPLESARSAQPQLKPVNAAKVAVVEPAAIEVKAEPVIGDQGKF